MKASAGVGGSSNNKNAAGQNGQNAGAINTNNQQGSNKNASTNNDQTNNNNQSDNNKASDLAQRIQRSNSHVPQKVAAINKIRGNQSHIGGSGVNKGLDQRGSASVKIRGQMQNGQNMVVEPRMGHGPSADSSPTKSNNTLVANSMRQQTISSPQSSSTSPKNSLMLSKQPHDQQSNITKNLSQTSQTAQSSSANNPGQSEIPTYDSHANDNNSGVRRRATYVYTSNSRRNTKQDQE